MYCKTILWGNLENRPLRSIFKTKIGRKPCIIGFGLLCRVVQGDPVQTDKSNIFNMGIFFRIFGLLCTISHRTEQYFCDFDKKMQYFSF